MRLCDMITNSNKMSNILIQDSVLTFVVSFIIFCYVKIYFSGARTK